MVHEIIGKLINNGKITIPKSIRDLDKAHDGDTVKLIYVEALKRDGIERR